jgi:hypothetical protein
MNIPKRELLLLRLVFALPKLSKMGEMRMSLLYNSSSDSDARRLSVLGSVVAALIRLRSARYLMMIFVVSVCHLAQVQVMVISLIHG